MLNALDNFPRSVKIGIRFIRLDLDKHKNPGYPPGHPQADNTARFQFGTSPQNKGSKDLMTILYKHSIGAVDFIQDNCKRSINY